jgi:restriction endonuclease S subunit
MKTGETTAPKKLSTEKCRFNYWMYDAGIECENLPTTRVKTTKEGMDETLPLCGEHANWVILWDEKTKLEIQLEKLEAEKKALESVAAKKEKQQLADLRAEIEQDIEETESDYYDSNPNRRMMKDGRISGLKWVLSLLPPKEEESER